MQLSLNRALLQLILGIALLAATLVGFTSYQAVERSDELRLWFFDIGQGDAMLFDAPTGQQVLIDGGPDTTILKRLSQVLAPTDKTIDLAIVTHNHADHLAGIVEVLKRYEIKEIWISGAVHTTDTYRTFLELIKEKQIKTKAVAAGQTIQFGDLSGTVLYPFESQADITPKDQNALSLVTLWRYGTTTILMTGDAGIEQEQAVLQKDVVGPVTILKVGHQGSKTSSSEVFLNAIRPKIGIISVGKYNQYNHPHPEVIERFKALNIPILRTDYDRTIRFDIWVDHYSHTTNL